MKRAMRGTNFSTAFGKMLQRLLGCGVGVHHAGMLPRYRLLVEKLAQQGLLPVICGTDTLGVGINVPIHTVVFTQLTKFDGTRMRRLRAREFHQIAGRAGRSGFDTEGMVIAQAPEHEIENAKLLAKAGNDPKRVRKVKKKQAPEGFVAWNEKTLEKLVASPPETLVPRMRITHSMVLSVIARGKDAFEDVAALIDESAQTDEQKLKLRERSQEIFETLINAQVVSRVVDEGGSVRYEPTGEMPDDLALDQPLSPFMLAALELLDPEEDTYALDVISLAESTLENPRQVLRAQERRAKERAMAEMKAEGIEYEERLERLASVTYPKPLEELLDAAFARYCESIPWARDFHLEPKSVLRDMLETVSDFKSYVGRYGIARSEGTLLRYLSDAWRVLEKTLPLDKRNEQLWDVISWLRLIVKSTDSSLVDEWESAGQALDVSSPSTAENVVPDRRGLTVIVRNALFRRIRLAARNDARALGELDAEWGCPERTWRRALEDYAEEYDEIIIDADARSATYFHIDDADEAAEHVWHVQQIAKDPDDERAFSIIADVDLDASQERGEAIFANYRVGMTEDLLHSDV